MTGGTPWWGTLLATAVTALAAIGGVSVATWRQNKRARREEWFRRLQWAEELRSCGDEGRRAVGAAVLESLASSDLATRDDLELVDALGDSSFVDTALADIPLDSVDEIDFVEDTGNEALKEET